MGLPNDSMHGDTLFIFRPDMIEQLFTTTSSTCQQLKLFQKLQCMLSARTA
jgi:hypothetical protein